LIMALAPHVLSSWSQDKIPRNSDFTWLISDIRSNEQNSRRNNYR
jgi:hypothetical protein